ncbi:hypothetical protein HPB52_015403 [Rhipicephalus sanguineus]|uniref:Uncharacterized protein n=1 Tax=Rhipicephalus sanguineus TaxID=34632 RepID=A0A9D4SUG7_RHISA|nr:hypothetical protein HPB52_015403 [Rhipicephalus sanguineus]
MRGSSRHLLTSWDTSCHVIQVLPDFSGYWEPAGPTWEVEFRENFETAGSNGTTSYRFTVTNVRFFVTFFELPEIIRYYYSSHGHAARDHLLFCVALAHWYMGLAFYASYIQDEATPEVIEDVNVLLKNVRASFREGYAASPMWKQFVERSTQSRAGNGSSSSIGPPLN